MVGTLLGLGLQPYEGDMVFVAFTGLTYHHESHIIKQYHKV